MGLTTTSISEGNTILAEQLYEMLEILTNKYVQDFPNVVLRSDKIPTFNLRSGRKIFPVEDLKKKPDGTFYTINDFYPNSIRVGTNITIDGVFEKLNEFFQNLLCTRCITSHLSWKPIIFSLVKEYGSYVRYETKSCFAILNDYISSRSTKTWLDWEYRNGAKQLRNVTFGKNINVGDLIIAEKDNPKGIKKLLEDMYTTLKTAITANQITYDYQKYGGLPPY